MKEKKGPRIAVALTYRQGKNRAPVVTAVGKGRIAHRIINLAEEHGVPVEKNPSLARALHRIRPGQEIPAELYNAVAVLLSYILEADTQARVKRKKK